MPLFQTFYTKIIYEILTNSLFDLLQTAKRLAIIGVKRVRRIRPPLEYWKRGKNLTMGERRKFAIILAAGDGKRMKSENPKVLCEVLFQPMLKWVENACRAAGIEEIYVVAGDREDLLRKISPGCQFVRQSERRGTGHAVMMAADALADGGDVVVLNGDAPLISAEDIENALTLHRARHDAVTLVTARVRDPYGYGRILRDMDDAVLGIVEQRDADARQQRIDEINSGAYWFDAAFLARALKKLTISNAQGEYYLTDTVAIAVREGLSAGGYLCPDCDAVLGANDRRGLQALNDAARRRIMGRHMDAGVDIPCADGVMIGPEVEIGRDARILPGTILRGKTKIGVGAVIGPNSQIIDSEVGAGAQILSSWLTESSVGENASVGPFSQLRPNSHVGAEVKIGDFVELKNTTVGDATSIAHLTYIGDSDVGMLCNFGCGVVTANYDGSKKFRTTIGDRAFIGCNTNLISPVNIGEGAYTAAGTTVDGDIPAGALSIGRARQEIREGWADERIRFKAEELEKRKSGK